MCFSTISKLLNNTTHSPKSQIVLVELNPPQCLSTITDTPGFGTESNDAALLKQVFLLGTSFSCT